jgi:hypothetical protein
MYSQVVPSALELVGAAVKVALEAGLSWDDIGDALGMDSQAASGRYAAFVGGRDWFS